MREKPVSFAKKVRFQAMAVDGAKSEAWVIWTTAGYADVYMASRNSAGSIKISLHESGVWQHGYTSEYADKTGVPSTDRLFSRWNTHPEVVPGWQLAVQLVLATSQLRSGGPAQPPTVCQIPVPEPGSDLIVELWLETAGVNTPLPLDEAVQVGTLGLCDGGSASVVGRRGVLPWVPEEYFAREITGARQQLDESGWPDSPARIVVHEVDEPSGTLLMWELAIDPVDPVERAAFCRQP